MTTTNQLDELSKALADYRASKNWSVKRFAQELGLHPATLSNLINKTNNCSEDRYNQLMDWLTAPEEQKPAIRLQVNQPIDQDLLADIQAKIAAYLATGKSFNSLTKHLNIPYSSLHQALQGEHISQKQLLRIHEAFTKRENSCNLSERVPARKPQTVSPVTLAEKFNQSIASTLTDKRQKLQELKQKYANLAQEIQLLEEDIAVQSLNEQFSKEELQGLLQDASQAVTRIKKALGIKW